MKTYTLEQIKKSWHSAYNENIEADYKGFINILKKKSTKKKVSK
jgi:hypothetical protein